MTDKVPDVSGALDEAARAVEASHAVTFDTVTRLAEAIDAARMASAAEVSHLAHASWECAAKGAVPDRTSADAGRFDATTVDLAVAVLVFAEAHQRHYEKVLSEQARVRDAIAAAAAEMNRASEPET